MDFDPANLTDDELIRMADSLAVTRELVMELAKRLKTVKNRIDVVRAHINGPKKSNRIR